MNGQVVIASLGPIPQSLQTFLTTNDPDSDEPFVNLIRAYNHVLAFTSLGANIDEQLANAREGVYTFRIQGALYDTDLNYQLQRRKEIIPRLNRNMLQILQNELHSINPFVKTFTNAGNRARQESISDMSLIIHNTHGKDMRRYNQPTASEVAVIMSDFNQVPELRDIIIKTHEDELKHISELNGAYDPLQYPLLFPYGEYGWHDNILRANEVESETPGPGSRTSDVEMEIEPSGSGSRTGTTTDFENLMLGVEETSTSRDKGKGKAVETDPLEHETGVESEHEAEVESNDDDESTSEIQTKKHKRVTIREFAVYRIQIRDSNRTTSTLHLSGRLFQQYLVDQYAKWESNNLRWHKENQQNFRTEIYLGLQDIVSEDVDYNKIGKKIILSSYFTESTRYMQQLYQDSMAIVREFGKPDLFVTVTCNPNWPEITNELLSNQQASDRPDLVVRVFKLKLEAITHDLFEKGVLGRVLANIHVIEFQKRGLPHAHILMILTPEDKPRTPEDFDKIVCAEFPDEVNQPLLC